MTIMSIEIRQMLIKSQVIQRAENGDDAVAAGQPEEHVERDWRSECRRLISEVLNERKER